MVNDDSFETQLASEFQLSPVSAALSSEPIFDELNKAPQVGFVLLPVRQTASGSGSKDFQCVVLALLHQFYEFRKVHFLAGAPHALARVGFYLSVKFFPSA